MPKSTSLNRPACRQAMLDKLAHLLDEAGEEVLRVKGNAIAIPAVDENGNEYSAVFTVSIPIGSRDGDVFDPYELAEDYKLKQEENAFKAQQRANKRTQEAAEREKHREETRARKLAEEERRLAVREAMIKAEMEKQKNEVL